MKAKKFDALVPQPEYKAVIFGANKEVEEAALAGRLFSSLKTGQAEPFVVAYFEKLASNVQAQKDAKIIKVSARLLTKSQKALNDNRASLSDEAASKIAACIQIGISQEERRKKSKYDGIAIAKEPLALDPVATAHYGKFPEDTCLVKDLRAKAALLRANNFQEAKKLHQLLEGQTRKHPQRDINQALNTPTRDFPGADLNWTYISGHQQFLFTSCPKNPNHAGVLFDALNMKGGSLFVSTLESHEGQSRWNHFWTKAKVETLPLRFGWKLEYVGERTLATGTNPGHADPKLIETTLRATNGAQTKIMTHLHYDAWIDHETAGDEELLLSMLQRMKELSPDPKAPISINCHGGIGRTGVTGLSFELCGQIDAQLAADKKLDEITINVAEALYTMRLQGRHIIGQPAQMAQVYAVVGAYYEKLQLPEVLPSALPATLPKHPAGNLIAAYAK